MASLLSAEPRSGTRRAPVQSGVDPAAAGPDERYNLKKIFCCRIAAHEKSSITDTTFSLQRETARDAGSVRIERAAFTRFPGSRAGVDPYRPDRPPTVRLIRGSRRGARCR